MKKINRLIFAFSLVGLLLTSYLAFEYSRNQPITCPVLGSGCDLVRKSQYSSIAGIDLPDFGVIFYLVIAFLSILLVQSYKKSTDLFRLLVSFFGFAFGVYLTLLEAFVIKAYCFWCVSSFIISTVIFILCLKYFKR